VPGRPLRSDVMTDSASVMVASSGRCMLTCIWCVYGVTPAVQSSASTTL
jgi:hypothetical protein